MFAALLADVPLRDDKEGMSVPLVSLAKNVRTAPIEWKSSDGTRYVRVTANLSHGMATIWDYDILIWAISQLNAAVEAGREVSSTLRFHPYDLLRGIRRHVGGKDYLELEAALNRLTGTLVETNLRSANVRRRSTFHLLEQWEHETDENTGESRGLSLTLPQWILEGVVQHRDVLAIPADYFELSSGIARWIYRLARRHAGKQATGWRFTMKELHARSGSTRELKDFAKDVRKVVAAQEVPDYQLDIVRSETGEEVVRMVRDSAKAKVSRRKDTPKLKLPQA